jgi:hypothetical protein
MFVCELWTKHSPVFVFVFNVSKGLSINHGVVLLLLIAMAERGDSRQHGVVEDQSQSDANLSTPSNDCCKGKSTSGSGLELHYFHCCVYL